MADVRDEKLAKLIGRNISNLLLKRGKNQKDLCDNLGFSPASVSSWVNGTRIPKEGNIVLMAAYLDCSVDDIALDPKEAHRKRSFSIPVYARVGAGPPLEASEEIIDRVVRLGKMRAKEVTVVSSDQHVQWQCRQAGAAVINSEVFAENMNRTFSSGERNVKHSKKSQRMEPKLSQREVEEWLEIFGENP